MAKFELILESDNAAFDPPDAAREVVRIIREIAAKVDRGEDGGPVRDANGNTVGHWFIDIPEPEPCELCEGTGKHGDHGDVCAECNGTGVAS